MKVVLRYGDGALYLQIGLSFFKFQIFLVCFNSNRYNNTGQSECDMSAIDCYF
jgi:hypothetical protein